MKRAVLLIPLLLAWGACNSAPQPESAQPTAAPAYSGGDGSSMKEAVIITASTDSESVHAEYAWLRLHAPGATLKTQGLTMNGSHSYDTLEVVLADGSTPTYYFDISSSFGKR